MKFFLGTHKPMWLENALCTMTTLASSGLNLHGFGFKTHGLEACADALLSADSLAWSFDARRSAPLAGHTHGHCGNCLEYALMWRKRLALTLALPEAA